MFDALTSERSYKSPMGFDEAMQIILRESGSHFDSSIVAAFRDIAPALYATIRECQEFCVRDGFDSSCPAAAEQEESAHRAIAGMKRSVYRMANWFIAGFQYSIGFSIQP